jgi:hypothetical protein
MQMLDTKFFKESASKNEDEEEELEIEEKTAKARK